MNRNAIRICSDVASEFAHDFHRWSKSVLLRQDYATVALSGGSTPKKLFEIWGRGAANFQRPDWNRIHFFWGDERCVPPTDPESNFGVANQLWLSQIDIEPTNVHRVKGEAEPVQECRRYAEEIFPYARPGNSDFSTAQPIPELDLVILGMGSDGHIASIFPDRLELLKSSELCAVATHPLSGQQRITFTGRLILQAARIVFLITGSDKASVLQQVFDQVDGYLKFPVAHIAGAQVEYFLDEAAASKLSCERK